MDYLTLNLLFLPDALVWLALLMTGCFFAVLTFNGKYPSQFITCFWVLLLIQFAVYTLTCFESGGIFNVICATVDALILFAGFITQVISAFKTNDHAHNRTTH